MRRISLLGFKCELCENPAENIHHKDRDRTNNNLENLMRLCVICHKRIHNSFGENHHLHKLTEAQVKEIKSLREKGSRIDHLAQVYNLSEAQISRICNNKRWSHLSPSSCIRRQKLTNEDVEKIKTLLKSGETQRKIGKMFGVSHTNIQKISSGEIWNSMKN